MSQLVALPALRTPLAGLQVDVYKAWVSIASIIVSLSFAFGQSIRQLYEAAVFVFYLHPFDVEDAVEIDTNFYKVVKIQLLSTELMTASGERWVWCRVGSSRSSQVYYRVCTAPHRERHSPWVANGEGKSGRSGSPDLSSLLVSLSARRRVVFPNSVLSSKVIYNHSRSDPWCDSVEFHVDISFPRALATEARRSLAAPLARACLADLLDFFPFFSSSCSCKTGS